ncbi:MAG: hypothetical protein H0V51_09825 [Chloroflexi bacterium]|nr:hypothetical protein [Chloroflexota bacterium]
MDQVELESPDRQQMHWDAGDDGINLVTVVIMLLVLLGFVALMFWIVPTWFAGGNVNVTIRN